MASLRIMEGAGGKLTRETCRKKKENNKVKGFANCINEEGKSKLRTLLKKRTLSEQKKDG
jgi:hypothetical protein